jgi:SAM-dependent methyltransferase
LFEMKREEAIVSETLPINMKRIREFHQQCGQTIEPDQAYAGVSGRQIIHSCRSYLHETTRLFQMIIDCPGDWRNTEFMYDALPESPNDCHMLATGAARGIYARLPTVCRMLSETVYELLDVGGRNQPIRILNLGSGPGRDTIWLCQRFPELVEVTCVEKCRDAIAEGRRRSQSVRLNGNHRFLQENMLALSVEQEYDVLLLVGVLCPLSLKEAAVLLRRIRRYAKPGGRLLATNVTPTMEADDPFGDFLIRNFANWHLRYKTRDEMESILCRSHWHTKRIANDSMGYHWIVEAERQ